ncbi:MAG: sigma-70 family RNA polymerase sigma factor [Ruthenibacterium lactatiformans]
MKDDVLSMQIEQARNGDEQAIAGLIARQMPQIRSLAAKAVRPGLDFDDAVQEGIIGLFSALETFDAQKGAAFATYANVCVQNAIVSAVRGGTAACAANTSVPYTETESTPAPKSL